MEQKGKCFQLFANQHTNYLAASAAFNRVRISWQFSSAGQSSLRVACWPLRLFIAMAAPLQVGRDTRKAAPVALCALAGATSQRIEPLAGMRTALITTGQSDQPAIPTRPIIVAANP